jgi:hypothetical protein
MAVSTLSDAFLRLQLRVVREEGSARLMLLDSEEPREIARRIYHLAYEQGLAVAVEFDAASLSIVEATAAAAALG